MTRKTKWTSESVGEYERSLKPIEQPKVRTGNCLRIGVCASEGHKIQPQRPWVGLTEKDIFEAAVKSQEGISPRNDTLRFATAIEAKLKEKNT